jgi:UDP-glucose 4-epimerase
MFEGKTLLITGGTGSFGNEVLKLFLNTDIKEIRIFSRDEKKQEDLRIKYMSDKIKFFIGDVRDYNSIVPAMKNVDFVFHAAALKQVPSCEFFPYEAVKTNVIGTENVLNCAIEHKVSKVICLSTDKAAYPVNAMGISKAMMEKIALSKARDNNHQTLITVTRYGNVMASRGSVIPLFIEQIKANKSITVTDPNMTRFLMSLEEAVTLVVFAFKESNSGDIMVQKADSCTIGDLAIALKELFKSNSDILIIGSRHAEKLYETLLTKEEKIKSQDMGKFFRVPLDIRNLNYQQYLDNVHIEQLTDDDYNSHNTKRLTVEEIKQKLLTIPYVQEELMNWRNNK